MFSAPLLSRFRGRFPRLLKVEPASLVVIAPTTAGACDIGFTRHRDSAFNRGVVGGLEFASPYCGGEAHNP